MCWVESRWTRAILSGVVDELHACQTLQLQQKSNRFVIQHMSLKLYSFNRKFRFRNTARAMCCAFASVHVVRALFPLVPSPSLLSGLGIRCVPSLISIPRTLSFAAHSSLFFTSRYFGWRVLALPLATTPYYSLP
jgi:hypothetical protein